MGLFDNLFSNNTYSKSDIDVISTNSQRIVDIINESLRIANDSVNPDTKLSRLSVAKSKLNELEELANQYSFITITSHDEIVATIAEIENWFMLSGLKKIADGNATGQSLEKDGKMEDAIAQYEKLVENNADTPFTYRRLAILYKKAKKQEDEIRIIKAALSNVPKSNAKHYIWFQDRLMKMKK